RRRAASSPWRHRPWCATGPDRPSGHWRESIRQQLLVAFAKSEPQTGRAVADQRKPHPPLGNEAREILDSEDRIAAAEAAQRHDRPTGRDDDRRRKASIDRGQQKDRKSVV